MTRWLVISNCQTRGLAQSLAVQSPGLEVDECEILAYRKDHAYWAARLADYAKIVINTQFYESDLQADCAGMDKVLTPQIYFPGYHPDETLLFVDGAPIESGIGLYHSLIAFAAYRRGLGAAETVALYRRETYEALDYLGWWSDWRRRLIEEFAAQNLDISGAFNRWSRGRAFMYTSHHPRMECLYDIAGLILAAHGRAPQRVNGLPQDHLATDTWFPVYSEIATGLGFEGSYQFKVRSHYRSVDLPTFVAQSFAIYDTMDVAKVTIEDNRRSLFETLERL